MNIPRMVMRMMVESNETVGAMMMSMITAIRATRMRMRAAEMGMLGAGEGMIDDSDGLI